jgi:hypothetical protein
MSDDTRRRFLLAIAEQIPAERVDEVRLFRPLRQGGHETGVAVVAVGPDAAGNESGPTNGVSRHVVYSARYRLVLKGHDRGRWEASVTAEADAPIATVEAVVRGVQRRAGDEEDPERLTGERFREELLREPWMLPRG